MAAACTQAEAIFRAGTSFLVVGETGTGKSALVAALAGEAPILKVDCASLLSPDTDIGALRAVFGQARSLSAMPGASAGRATVVLDNVEETPARVQVELRRLVDELEEDQQAGAAGGPVLPRLVALAKRPLDSAVEEGRFRDDLYFRLAAAQVFLPPLRERERPDILAQALASQIAGRTIEFSDGAAALIRAYPFPGNVRELRGALERALIAAADGRITPVDLRATSIASARPAEPMSPAPRPRLAGDERTLVLDALTSSGWNVSEAARRLGIGRATINRKIKRYGLVRPG